MLYLPPLRNGPVFHRYTESHKVLLDFTFPGLILLKAGLKPIVSLPKLKILEFHGEMDVVGDHFQDIILERLDPTRCNIAILKSISATLCDPLAAARDISWNILHHNRRAKIRFFIDIDLEDMSEDKNVVTYSQ